MSEEEKEANELIEKFKKYSDGVCKSGFWFSKLRDENAKQCALVCVEAKYYALREMLFSMKSNRIIESDKFYLFKVDELIHREMKVKEIITNK